MKRVFLRHKKLHLWLLCTGGLLLLFHGGKQNRGLMNGVAGITGPLKEALGALCALAPFSVAEVLIAAGLGVLALYLAAFAADLARRRERFQILYTRLLALACAALSLYAAFCLLWGVNYYADGFQEKAGLYGRPVTAAELADTTAYFAGELNRLSGSVARDGDGTFTVPRRVIYDAAPEIYRGAERLYPFLAMEDERPKEGAFSRRMSRAKFTGFYFPFTGEITLNGHSPACLLPATIAHELSHCRGIASEQECNFLAVLACEESGNGVYAYSGALLAFIHLSNALHEADLAAWEEIHAGLEESVRADLRENNGYWAQFESKTAAVSQKIYDSFLKGYGEAQGIRSYGEVVDLLVAYYGERENSPRPCVGRGLFLTGKGGDYFARDRKLCTRASGAPLSITSKIRLPMFSTRTFSLATPTQIHFWGFTFSRIAFLACSTSAPSFKRSRHTEWAEALIMGSQARASVKARASVPK